MLTEYLRNNTETIRNHIETTDAQWSSFLKRLSAQVATEPKDGKSVSRGKATDENRKLCA
jgi:hypothetical protein